MTSARRSVPALLLVSLCGLGCGVQPTPPERPASGTGNASPGVRLHQPVVPLRASLRLDIDAAVSRFRGDIEIEVEASRPFSQLLLRSRGLAIHRANVGAMTATVEQVTEDVIRLRLREELRPGRYRMRLAYAGEMSSATTEGIYRVQEPDGSWFVYTLFEPVDGRRAFPFFDEPEHKIPWRLSFRTPSDQVALGNAPVAERRALPGGTVETRLVESAPMPSYLVAFVVGPFDLYPVGPVGRAKKELRFVVPPGRRSELAYAAEVSPKIVEALENYFDMELPFRKLDVAIVPRDDGTMEHPGLTAMGQALSLIHSEEDSEQRREEYARIFAHELAHYWFGNLVTMEWWTDLWLNESFATWMATKAAAAAEPEGGHEYTALAQAQYAKQIDALRSAKAVRSPVSSELEMMSAFDSGTTYYKGAAVISMFEAFLGEERLQQALRSYVMAHRWGTVTAPELYAAFDRTEPGLGAALAGFIERPGVPFLSVALDCEPSPTVTVTQKRFLAAGDGDATVTWAVPICLRWEGGQTCTLLSQQRTAVPLDTTTCPRWIEANAGARGYYRVSYADDLAEARFGRAFRALTVPEQLNAIADLEALVMSGRAPVDDALPRLVALVKRSSPMVAKAAVEAAVRFDAIVSPGLRNDYRRHLRESLSARAPELAWEGPAGEGRRERELRVALLEAVALLGDAPALRNGARDYGVAFASGERPLPPDLLRVAVAVAARHGDAQLFDRLEATALGSRDHRRRGELLAVLGRFRDPQLLRRAFALVVDDRLDPRDSAQILWAAFDSVETRGEALAFLRSSYPRIIARWAAVDVAALFGVTEHFCDRAARAALSKLLSARVSSVAGAPLALANGLERADVCIAGREQQAEAFKRLISRR